MSRDGPMVLLTGGSVMAGLLTGVVLVQSAFEEPTQEAEQALAICRWKLLPPTENLPARGRGGTLTTACADILGLLPGPIQLRPSAAAPPRQPIAAVRALRSWPPRVLGQGLCLRGTTAGSSPPPSDVVPRRRSSVRAACPRSR